MQSNLNVELENKCDIALKMPISRPIYCSRSSEHFHWNEILRMRQFPKQTWQVWICPGLQIEAKTTPQHHI